MSIVHLPLIFYTINYILNFRIILRNSQHLVLTYLKLVHTYLLIVHLYFSSGLLHKINLTVSHKKYDYTILCTKTPRMSIKNGGSHHGF